MICTQMAFSYLSTMIYLNITHEQADSFSANNDLLDLV